MKTSMLRMLAAGGLVLAGLVPAAAQPAMTGDSSLGPILTDHNGMSLYTFDNDEGGMSACTGQCAENWPPLVAAADAQPEGDYTIITRDDGTRQWAYKGKPLYLWVKDAKAGDVTGDNVNNVWHVAKP
jgi:predicted lipoprotein with Yx(FWY)xxD motif